MKLKAWFKESSFAYAALKKIVLDKRLVNDLKYLTDFNHPVPFKFITPFTTNTVLKVCTSLTHL